MDELLSVVDPVLEGLLHSGNPAYRDPRFEHLKEHLHYFEKELKKVGVTRKLSEIPTLQVIVEIKF